MTVWIQNPFDNLPCEGYRKQRFWLMSEAFAAAGHTVVFWTSDFSHATKQRRKIIKAGERVDATGFRLRLVPTRPYARNVGLERIASHADYARTWHRLAREEAAQARPDVIIASVPTVSAAETAHRLAREFGARFVLDVMDAWPETFERLAPHGLRWAARLLLLPLRRRVRRLYRVADLVTGVCTRYRSLTNRADYHLAYHGIGGVPVKRTARPADGMIRLAYAGNLGRTYDLKTVLAAMASNSDFTLDIAGDWRGPVPPRVTAHGYLGQEALRQMLADCDIGVIPMRPDSWVGLPYKLCDYAQAGLRIVSSLGGESSELLAKYRCGVTYRSGDAVSLAAAIRQAAALNPDAAHALCKRELAASRIYAEYVGRVVRVVTDGGREIIV